MLNRALSFVERGIILGTYGALFAMMTLITIDAIVRYLFRETLPDVYHLTELYLMPMVVFFALANTQRLEGHVSVNLLDNVIPRRLKALFLALVYLAACLCFAVITWRSWLNAWSDLTAWRVTAGVIPWPTGLSRIIVPIGSAVLVARLLLDAGRQAALVVLRSSGQGASA